jgi:hypothetical protein
MSDIEFACPQCGTQLAVDAEGAGITVACPNCAKLIVIPVVQSETEPKADVSEPGLPADTRKGAGTQWGFLLASGAATIVVVLAAVWFLFPRNPETRAAKPVSPQTTRSAVVVSVPFASIVKTNEVVLVNKAAATSGAGLEQGKWTRPDWFNKVQFLQGGYGYIGKNTGDKDPLVPLDVYTGQGWGFYLSSGGRSDLRDEVEAWHARKGVYLFSGAVDTLYGNHSILVPESHRLMGMDGSYVNESATGCKQYTICSPEWRAFLKQYQLRHAIDLGAEGICLDGGECPYIGFFDWNPIPSTFDPVTMGAFRNYLKDRYSPGVLKTRFGIEDITRFNLGEWIKSTGRRSTWNKEPLVGLGREYFGFRILETRKAYHELVSDAHDYARQTYGRNFVVSANANFGALGYYVVDEFDMFCNEHYPFDKVDSFAATDVKAYKAIGRWPVAVGPEPKRDGLPKAVTNMMRLALADIYASGGTVCFGKNLTEGLGKPITTDQEVIRRYARFIVAHRELYENLSFSPQVALFDSMASRNARYWSQDPKLHVDWEKNFYGTGRLLIDQNIQFDCVFAPDERFCTLPPPTLQQLQKYKVVILPHTPLLSDPDANLLLNYIKAGGRVVAMGNIGTHTPDGAPVNRPELQALQQQVGMHKFGKGLFVYTAAYLGEDYISGDRENQSVTRARFDSMLIPFIQPEVKTSNVSEVYRRGGATGFLYRDSGGDYILHLVNYDFNEFTDQFAAKQNVVVSILADSAVARHAVFVSPDIPNPQPLTATFTNGYITVTIPKLEAYGVVVLRQNDSAAATEPQPK